MELRSAVIAVKKFFVNHWQKILIGLIGTFFGFLIQVWRIYWVEVSNLHLEVSGIERKVSDDFYLDINKLQDPEISHFLLTFISTEYFGYEEHLIIRRNRRKVTMEELKTLLTEAQDRSRVLEQSLEEQTAELNRIRNYSPNDLNSRTIDELNAPLIPEIYMPYESENQRRVLLQAFISRYEMELDKMEERHNSFKEKYEEIEPRISSLLSQLEKNHSIFRITLTATNSGRSTISIKGPALLRVYIGSRNYVDIRMLMIDSEENAEIPALGTKTLYFVSAPVTSLLYSDQELINQYWGQNVHSILFIENSLGEIHASLKFSFASGQYQKITYDRLQAEAAKEEYFHD